MNDNEMLNESEAREYRSTLLRFVKAYKVKPESMSDEEWLTAQLGEELPDHNPEDLKIFSHDTIDAIRAFDSNYADVTAAAKRGQSKESWFASKAEAASVGVSVNQYGQYMAAVDNALQNANIQMQRTIQTQAGNISNNFNLDGFIAEQQHVNAFNARAALDGSAFRAEVCSPAPGQTYGLNSFDVVIKNLQTGKKVQQYQLKYGADAKATIAMLKNGNYNNQRFLVPAEQVAEVQAAFPGKTVTGVLGGTADIPNQSNPLTKADVKQLQNAAQKENHIPLTDWNTFEAKELAVNLGKNAALAGVQAAAITVGINVISKVCSGEEIEGEELVITALDSGADAGIKACAAGALKVVSEKGALRLLPPGTPTAIIANIACVGIENIKILIKLASGQITISESLDQMGRTTVAMSIGLMWAGEGAAIGAGLFSFIPVVGPFVGSLVGGAVGYIAGSSTGDLIYATAKKVATAAVKTVQGIFATAAKLKEKVMDKVRRANPFAVSV